MSDLDPTDVHSSPLYRPPVYGGYASVEDIETDYIGADRGLGEDLDVDSVDALGGSSDEAAEPTGDPDAPASPDAQGDVPNGDEIPEPAPRVDSEDSGDEPLAGGDDGGQEPPDSEPPIAGGEPNEGEEGDDSFRE